MAIYTPRMRSLGNINSTPFNSVQTARNINPITRVIRNIGNIDAALSPMSIFSSGVGGCWLDPSDMTTLYQDAAGTIPVTAVEQPVGKMLDKSGNGYHATQSITASRPVLSARKNVLLATDVLATQSVTAIAAQYTLSFTGTGSVTLSGTATGTLTGTGTDRASLTFTPTAGTLTLTVSGSVTKAQVELGSTAGPYQRVNTTTDYDTDERYFPKYLRFDGVDDYLTLGDVFDIDSEGVSIATSVILFDATKSPIAGKSRATSGGGRYFLGTEPGSFLFASHDIAPTVNIAYSQSIGESVVLSAKLGPHGARYLSLYKNAALINSIGTTLTTSSYDTNNPFWIGAYPNASGTTPAYAYLNGGIYGLIITKSALTDAQRVRCERFLARKAGVML